MQKAHLYETIFLVDQGIDQAVRGRERLKKAPGFAEEIYRDTLAMLEHVRAQMNLRYFGDVEQAEKRDAARYDGHKNNERDSSPRIAP